MEQPELIKQALLFINAHRDGCVGSMLAEHLGMTNDQVITLLDDMAKDNLIDIIGDKPLQRSYKLSNYILITGGYSDPRYSQIY